MPAFRSRLVSSLVFAFCVAASAGDGPAPAPKPHPTYRVPEKAHFASSEVRIRRPGDFTQIRVDPSVVQVPEDAFEIAGELSVPKEGTGPFPAVFFISGSGMQDRHGFAPGAPKIDLGTWQVLDAIADAGFVVLRVDDRATGGTPPGFQGVDYKEIGFQALVSDARTCVRWLRARPEVDPARVLLLGHSEGGVTATMLSGEAELRIAGVVCMAGGGRNLSEVIYEQVADAMKELPPAIREANLRVQRELMDATKAGREADPGIVPGWIWNRADVVAGRKWMREHFTLDATAMHKRVTCPALVVNGERDMQVSADRDARLLATELMAGPSRDVTLRIYADLDHLFKGCGGRPSTLKMYEEKREVDATFLADLVAWLQRHV